jgi:fibronectin-binding autotransporter adhesin
MTMIPTPAIVRRVRLQSPWAAIAAAVVATLSAAGSSGAADMYWVGSLPGNWSTTVLDKNWFLNDVAPAITWNNASVDSAYFFDSSLYNNPTISVTTPITLRGMSINSNYTINGGAASPLTFAAGSGGSLQAGQIHLNNAGFNISINATIAGSVGITKTGIGTLLLGGQNTYNVGNNFNLSATTVNGGTLGITASGAVLPAGQDVKVNAGATLNYGNGATINNSGSAIGNLILNGGNFRISGGSGDFYLNQLSSYSSGSVDLTGSSNYWMHFVKPGSINPSVYVTGPTTWTGAGGSRMQNDTTAPVPITVATGSTLTNGVILANGTGGKGFLLIGDPGAVNTMILTNPGNTADLIADSALYLAVTSLANLGTGSLTLQNTANDLRPGALKYDGGSATSNKPITLGPGGGQIQVTTAGANLTQASVIGENTPGSGLTSDSNGPGNTPGILTLTAANTYTGPTYLVYNGYLSVASIPNGGVAGPLGASSNSPANLSIGKPLNGGGGTLQYTGPTATTDRGITLSDGNGGNTDAIEVATFATKLTFTGQVTGNGALTKTGPGTLAFTNGANDYAGGTIVANGTLEVSTPAALGSGGLALKNGTTLAYSGATAGTSKSISLTTAATVNVETTGVNLTLSGTISETVAGSQLVLQGPSGGQSSIVTLAGTNTYTGPTVLGFLAEASVASLPNGGVAGPLGASSSAPANLMIGGLGTLQYTGATTTTDRGMTLSGSGFNTVEVTNAATNLTLTGQIVGTGTLTKAGAGTLTLVNTTNNFSGGVFVGAGTLTVGAAGAVIPSGSAVTVTTGGVFNIGYTSSDNSAAPLGTLTLDTGGIFRMSSGVPIAYYLNQLVIGANGGTVDLTGVTGGGMYFTGAGAAISVTGNSTWSGGSAAVVNLAFAELPVTIASGAMLTSSVDLFSGSGNSANRFRVTGGGTFYWTGPGTDTAYMTVSQARLRLDAPNPVKSTDLTLDAGTLQFTGPTATMNNNGPNSRAFTLAAGGGTVEVTNAATTLTVAGLITGTGALTKTGPGTLILTNPANSYSGGTVLIGGTLTASAGALGTGPVVVGPTGTYVPVGTLPPGSSITLNAGSLSVPAGSTVTLNGASVAGGFMRGAGTFVLTGGTMLTGVTTGPSTMLSQTGPTTYMNFTNGSPLMVNAPVVGGGSATTFDLFTNQGSGAITVMPSSMVAASDFQTYGMTTLNPGTAAMPTQLMNMGASNLFFNGGSRTFISIPSHAGMFDAGIDLHGMNAVVAGGLLVNNGYVVDSMGAGQKTIVADFGSQVKGAGFYQNSVQTVNGGKFQSGNSPGSSSFGSFTFGPGGVNNYVFAIDDATGTAGPSPDANGQVSGWGLVKAIQRPVGSITTPGDFAWTADPGHKLTFALQTLVNPTTVGTDVAGPMADFDPTRPYSWLAGQWTGAYSGPTDPAALNAATVFDTSGFQNPIAGAFGWSLDAADRTLSLTYTPGVVPEPGTLALTGLGAFGWFLCRRRKNRIRV